MIQNVFFIGSKNGLAPSLFSDFKPGVNHYYKTFLPNH